MHDFLDSSDAPPYAILSHRWGPPSQEVSYDEYIAGRKKETAGYLKIRSFCDMARSYGCNYGWIDTCCINKANSSELAEALNSMYRWYADAKVCFIYLEDVRSNSSRPWRWMYSDWFTRGWTLQELLAPRNAFFFEATWKMLGTKNDSDTIALLSRYTRIPEDCLSNPDNISQRCAAVRMSWLAGRKTTRPEDMAYCMLGILDVSMQLLYGTGEKAFIKLQLEFIRDHDDESIYAWTDPDLLAAGMLAASASCFRHSGFVTVAHALDETRPPFSLTSKGFELRISECLPREEVQSNPKSSVKFHHGCDRVKLVLRCRRSIDNARICIWLERQSRTTWCRVQCHSLDMALDREFSGISMLLPDGMVDVERVYYVPPMLRLGPTAGSQKRDRVEPDRTDQENQDTARFKRTGSTSEATRLEVKNSNGEEVHQVVTRGAPIAWMWEKEDTPVRQSTARKHTKQDSGNVLIDRGTCRNTRPGLKEKAKRRSKQSTERSDPRLLELNICSWLEDTETELAIRSDPNTHANMVDVSAPAPNEQVKLQGSDLLAHMDYVTVKDALQNARGIERLDGLTPRSSETAKAAAVWSSLEIGGRSQKASTEGATPSYVPASSSQPATQASIDCESCHGGSEETIRTSEALPQAKLQKGPRRSVCMTMVLESQQPAGQSAIMCS